MIIFTLKFYAHVHKCLLLESAKKCYKNNSMLGFSTRALIKFMFIKGINNWKKYTKYYKHDIHLLSMYRLCGL
jgi:hypothetical protein